MKRFERIVIDSEICHGKPTIKGTRIMVSNILSVLAGEKDIQHVLAYYPELTEADVQAALGYAAATIGEEMILIPSANP